MIDYSRLESSLRHLELQVQNQGSMAHRPELTELDREGISESVIQRFEVCFDTFWKLTKRHMTEILGLPDLPGSPKPILKIANHNAMLGGKIDQWLTYADARISTSHDYSKEKADAVLALVPEFLQDALSAFELMTGKPWS